MPLKLTQDETAGPNLTPMIDVVFLLVIFFMVATKFTEREQNLDLDLPEVASAGEPAPAPVAPMQIAVARDGQTKLDGEPVSNEQLVAKLSAAAKASSDVEVVINGDAGCPYQHIAAALAACREARVTEVSLPVEIAAAAASSGIR